MRVLCNVAMSVDGKIGGRERTHASFGSAEDHRRMSLLRRQADAIITGGATFRAFPHAMVEDPAAFPDPPARKSPPYNVIISRQGNVPSDAPAFSDGRVKPLLITGPNVTMLPLPRTVEVVQLEALDGKSVLKTLQARGVETVLLESGGDLSSLFFSAGLVDELFLTVVPVLLGAKGAPTPVDGTGWPVAHAPRLTLVECTQREGELFLHYRLPR